MQQLKRNGIALFYEEAGKGAPPILLVHGLAGDHTLMTPQFEHFGRTHRVVSVDLRGHGQSDKPQQEYTIAGFAEPPILISSATSAAMRAVARPHLPMVMGTSRLPSG